MTLVLWSGLMFISRVVIPSDICQNDLLRGEFPRLELTQQPWDVINIGDALDLGFIQATAQIDLLHAGHSVLYIMNQIRRKQLVPV